jgi:hypothetical protein
MKYRRFQNGARALWSVQLTVTGDFDDVVLERWV